MLLADLGPLVTAVSARVGVAPVLFVGDLQSSGDSESAGTERSGPASRRSVTLLPFRWQHFPPESDPEPPHALQTVSEKRRYLDIMQKIEVVMVGVPHFATILAVLPKSVTFREGPVEFNWQLNPCKKS